MGAVQPAGDDGGDEELRAVAARNQPSFSQVYNNKEKKRKGSFDLRVLTSVGHGELTRLGVLEGEVLVGELLAVDGLTTGTLQNQGILAPATLIEWPGQALCGKTHVALGEVTTLEHELGDHTVETRAGVTEAILTSAKLTEVAGSLGNDLVEELEDDTARRGA